MAVTIYTRQTCGFCFRALNLLDELGANYHQIPVDFDFAALKTMREKSNRRTVPQIWIGELHVGGCDELFDLHYQGKLVPLLEADRNNNEQNKVST